MPDYPVSFTQNLPASADLVIVGGGIVGAATAFFARRAGLRAVVLEARPMLATLTTPASTGAFRLQFDNPEEIALVREGVDLFEHFAEATGLAGYDIALRQQGYLFVATTEAAVARQQAMIAQQRGWGLDDIEWLDGAEIRRRFPYVTSNARGARFRARDGWLDVRKLTMGYAAASQATFVTEMTATGFTIAGGRATGVQTTRGSIAAGQVVIACGPFAGEVAALAGVKIPLSLVRRQKLVMPDVPEVPPDAPMTIDEETGAHWRPALHGAFLLCTQPNVPPGPPLADVPISADFAIDLLNPASPNAVARISPFWREVWARGTSHWFLQAGQYAYSPDHRPFLGPSPVDGLFVNCGYSGHGIMASTGGSRLVVDTMTGKLAPADNPFRLDRPIVARELDIL